VSHSAFQAGKTPLQGFTKVFAFLIVRVRIIDLSGVDLDDVEQFVASRFGAKVEAAVQCWDRQVYVVACSIETFPFLLCIVLLSA
jgi:hypothetical protein